jgi:futalosine hydrolase
VVLVVAATELEIARVADVPTLVCGIGPVEAALATARTLAGHEYDALLHIGVAGARSLEPAALVIGSESIYCDVIDASSVLPRVERVEPDPTLVAAARRALPHAHLVPIATAGRVGGGTQCEVEAMEGFGVLRAAALAGVPAFELRAISNAIDERDRSRWRLDDALAALQEAIRCVLAELPA